MEEEFEHRLLFVKMAFGALATKDEKYHYLIELGRALPPYPVELRTEDRIVAGCQSILYLDARVSSGRIHYQAHSDALISRGLAALLIQVYSNLPPEITLREAPVFLQELDLLTSLSPHRSNGLAHLYARMKQEALKSFLIKT